MDQASGLRQLVDKKASHMYNTATPQKKIKHLSPATPRVISVTSGKGGVGKTNIVGNLAIAFKRLGKRVLILDADLGLANIDIIFGLNPKYNINHVINGEKDIAGILTKGPEDIYIIPAGSGIQELSQLTEGQKLNLLSELDTIEDLFDIFLIDTGAGISSNVIYFNIAAGERIVVVTPEPTSITDAYALIKVLYTKHGTDTFKILVNMTKGAKEAESVYKNLSSAVTRFLGNISLDYTGFIPRDDNFQKAVKKQQAILQLYPETASSQSIIQLAEYIAKLSREDPSDGNIKFFWKKIVTSY
ncbi:MAG: MinD/ParA family protein [Deltaproteobacteria bacterium]|nr:MinD/ParA family protein [Deltaproteobacteria bacterium]